MPMYSNFKNDQAKLITKDSRILQRVADSLSEKNLKFFENKDILSKEPVDPTSTLRQAINAGVITASPVRNSELIRISMRSRSTQEAKQIVEAFRNAYMAVEGSKSSQGGDEKLQLLENERRVFAEKLRQQRGDIRRLAEEYGSVELTPRQEMMLRRVSMLQEMVTKADTEKLLLDIKIAMLEKGGEKPITPGNLFKMRQDFINSDLRVQNLTDKIIQLEQGLIVAKQVLAPTNPELKRKTDLLQSFKDNLEERHEVLQKMFEQGIAEESTRSRKDQLIESKAQLEGLIAHREILQAKLDKEDIETIKIGRKQLDIEEKQEQLALTKEVYDTIRRRIQELEMERKRPARISIPYEATVSKLSNKRIKFSMAIIFGSLACGILIAILIDKLDKSIYTPDDVVKRVGVRIIGTVGDVNDLDKIELPLHMACDYQTIQANLGLFNENGIPKKLVITSPGTRDGKTTFAINLATSLANAGKKVLLIDADLRKPDIRRMLNLPKGSMGLHDVLQGKDFESVVHSVPSTKGLDVLHTDYISSSMAFKILSQPELRKHLDIISSKYDHMIIDTPPVLAFTDALQLAQMVDGVILTSFAGHTEDRDLKETLKRVAQINVKVLGVVLNSVNDSYSYNRYSYGYYDRQEIREYRRKKNNPLITLASKNETKNSGKSKS
jgi:capsular exopolysaccharide synthesis family protein